MLPPRSRSTGRGRNSSHRSRHKRKEPCRAQFWEAGCSFPHCFWSELSLDSSWHEAEKLPVATGCENTDMRQIDPTFILLFLPFLTADGLSSGGVQGGPAAAEIMPGVKRANITNFYPLSSPSLTLPILLFSMGSAEAMWPQSLRFPATVFKWRAQRISAVKCFSLTFSE